MASSEMSRRSTVGTFSWMIYIHRWTITKVASSYVAGYYETRWFELPAVESVRLSDAVSDLTSLVIRSMLSERSPCFAAMRYYLVFVLRSGVNSRDLLVPSLMPYTSALNRRLSKFGVLSREILL